MDERNSKGDLILLTWFESEVYYNRRLLNIQSRVPNSDCPWFEVTEWSKEEQRDVCIGDGYSLLGALRSAKDNGNGN